MSCGDTVQSSNLWFYPKLNIFRFLFNNYYKFKIKWVKISKPVKFI